MILGTRSGDGDARDGGGAVRMALQSLVPESLGEMLLAGEEAKVGCLAVHGKG